MKKAFIAAAVIAAMQLAYGAYAASEAKTFASGIAATRIAAIDAATQ